ncbi:MAG TPA: HD domain-containing protein [Candidatus Limiplasma sp.]|nr:HD domain-containing protein [Candidatus Limiplasma sp.]
MQPTKAQAITLLEEGGALNPGPWIQHSYAVAQCAQRIARRCGLDPEHAYILGLLHDIGRRYGFTYLKHTIDGYRFLLDKGYPDPARICITHVFSTKSLDDYIGKIDVTPGELDEILAFVQQATFNDYDRLIQLCDTLAGATVMDMHARIADVERRYGRYPKTKRDAAEHLKAYFETKCGENIYRIVTDDETLWGL